jgi:ribosome biogenesis GTPase / thiamine phosphate phosphatase
MRASWCASSAVGPMLVEVALDVGVPVSTHTAAGIPALADHLRPGRSLALIGSSGVGKASLVNHWLGRDLAGKVR